MYAMPIYSIPKLHSDKHRLINNHSAGPFSLNAMINKNNIGMQPDNVQDLGHNLLSFQVRHGSQPVWLFKSDVSKAYCHLPMHPLWQLKQIVKINNSCYIDRCCCFGNRRSPDLWCTFISLVLWIAIHHFDISPLLAYMDDHFSFDPLPVLSFYPSYAAFFPSLQVKLFLLWDELGIQHEMSKQLFGSSLTIIGFLVNPILMTISLPMDSIHELMAHIYSFCDNKDRQHSLWE